MQRRPICRCVAVSRPSRVRPVLGALFGAALVLAASSHLAPADEPRLPAPAAAKVAAFRAVDWTERLKPARPDPAPPEWTVRCEAEWALASLPAESSPALLPLLKDDDRFVRALAARSAGIARPEGAAEALVAALAAEKDQVARIALIEAVARAASEPPEGPEHDAALAAIEALQVPGANADVVFHVGMARRQLQGGAWDLVSLRGEHVEAQRTTCCAAEVGEAAPEIALPSPDGPVNLSTLRGKIVVLVFAHGDCGAADAKALQRLAAKADVLSERETVVVVVDPHEKERTKAWSDRVKLPFTVASDPAGRAAAAYGVARQLFAGGEWLPSPGWFVLNREGTLVWRRIGKRMDDHPPLGDLMPVLDEVARGIRPSDD